MKTWKAIIAVVMVFAAGTMFGALIALRVAPIWHLASIPAREAVTRRMNERIDAELQLTPQQRQQVAGIIGENQRELADIRKEVAPRVHQIIRKSQAQIRALLTPEQQVKFDRLIMRGWRNLERAEH
jgi:Spy/CpxP family protein refolding chaperone